MLFLSSLLITSYSQLLLLTAILTSIMVDNAYDRLHGPIWVKKRMQFRLYRIAFCYVGDSATTRPHILLYDSTTTRIHTLLYDCTTTRPHILLYENN